MATTSVDSGTFCKDMWRGPTWINTNFLVIRGLRRQGLNSQAQRLRDVTLEHVARWYRRTGCLWEFYDSLGVTPPSELDRKRRLSTGGKMGPISDYGWTAALALRMLQEAGTVEES